MLVYKDTAYMGKNLYWRRGIEQVTRQEKLKLVSQMMLTMVHAGDVHIKWLNHLQHG